MFMLCSVGELMNIMCEDMRIHTLESHNWSTILYVRANLYKWYDILTKVQQAPGTTTTFQYWRDTLYLTYLFLFGNGATVEIWNWIGDFMLCFTGHVIT